eukprot:4470004-Prymnesium_polylepis.1
MPARCFVPSYLFTLRATEPDAVRDPASVLNAARVTDAKLRDMQSLMVHFRRDLLWDVRGSRVAETMLLEAVYGHQTLAPGDRPRCCPFPHQRSAKAHFNHLIKGERG